MLLRKQIFLANIKCHSRTTCVANRNDICIEIDDVKLTYTHTYTHTYPTSHTELDFSL